MKKFLKVLLKVIVSIIAFVGGYILFAFVLARITVDGETNEPEEMLIYIKTNGVHTDIVVPVKNEIIDWSQDVEYKHPNYVNQSFKYLGMGWGDKGFYLATPTWNDLKLSVAFNAAFGLSNTAIHATFYRDVTVGERCRKIIISKSQYKLLTKFILKSFERDKYGKVINIGTNALYNDNDAFYEAKGSYSMFYTCNTWANNALKAGGLKACLWTPFDTGIFLKYE